MEPWRLERRLLHKEGDTADMLCSKVIIQRFMIGAFLARVLRMAAAAVAEGRPLGDAESHFVQAYNVFVLAGFPAACMWLWWRKVAGVAYQCAVVVFCLAVISFYDLLSMLEGRRGWMYFVLVSDILLLVQAPVGLRKALLGYLVFWLLLTGMELQVRFGLLDIPTLPPYADRAGACGCAEPPCPGGDAIAAHVVPGVVVMLLDFYATARFADAMMEEKRKMAAAVEASQFLARHLANFDLHAVSEYLDEHSDSLPHELHESFHALLANLESYRPFLPDALFHKSRSPARDDVHEEGTPGTATLAPIDTPSQGDIESNATASSGLCTPPTTIRLHGVRTPAPLTALDPLGCGSALQAKRMSLLVVALEDACESADYVQGHTKALTAVFDAVKQQRGALDRLSGDRVLASFNAFNEALNHSIYAVGAAVAVDAALPCLAGAAVVTGEAHVGYLGTATVRSPTVVGALPTILQGCLQAAMAVGERVVCCKSAAEENVRHPLRLLLHEFILRPGQKRRAQLYALDRNPPLVPAPRGGVSVRTRSHSVDDEEEWMYELDTAWDVYNTAAVKFHSRGPAAALALLQSTGAAATVVQRMRTDVVAALLVNLTPDVSRLPTPVTTVTSVCDDSSVSDRSNQADTLLDYFDATNGAPFSV